MPSISEILAQASRDWRSEPPASEEEILRLIKTCDVELPKEYLDLLRFLNGGEGSLALPPLFFVLYPVNEAIEMMKDEFYRNDLADFLFFGGNGGLELLAFDIRGGAPGPVVMIDPIAGPESAEKIAENFAQFIQAIGREYEAK